MGNPLRHHDLVKATIEKVVQTLFEAFALVAVVVFVFLGRLKATLVPIIAVPVALIGTFALMLAMGMSANTISLLALVLAIGIVVDDAIVVSRQSSTRSKNARTCRRGRHQAGDDADHRRSSPSRSCCCRCSSQ